jgi:CHAD domain-containing protein
MTAPTSLRLVLDSTQIASLLQHPLLTATPKRRRVHLTHFDTADQKVATLGLSINESRVLRKTTLTVQCSKEISSFWSAPSTPGTFDFATLIDDPETAEQLSQLTDQLVPIYSIEASQRQWTVQIRSAQVNVLLEEGVISTGDEASLRTRSFCELELQLNTGQPAALYGVARLLSRQLRLHPSTDTLGDQALAFSLGQTSGPVKAKRVKIDAKESVIAVFKQVVWICLKQLQDNEEGVFAPNNVEFIHQARVALRRLRTALRLFETELPAGFSDKWGQAWRDVGEQLGNARNWDVFCSELLPAMAADLGDHPDMLHLTEFAQAERQRAHAETQQWLHGRRYSLTLVAFCEALLMLPDRKTDRIDDFADKALKKRYKRFCRGARIAHTLNGEQRHEVRIDLKKLRYTLDFFESLYPQKQLQSFLGGLAETQELLGHMNDLVTGEALLALRPDNPFDLPVAWTKGRMSAYLETLPAALKPVLEAKTPW